MRTIQLRRYQLGEDTLGTFMDWWVSRVVPIREGHGYRVEFAYHLPESNEIVWACSVAGDRAAFDAVEAAYDADPARIEAFSHLPKGVVLSKDIRFVTDVNPADYRSV